MGSHTIKFGGFFNTNLNGQQPAWTDAPNFNFNSSYLIPNDSGNAIANMLLGNYQTLTQSKQDNHARALPLFEKVTAADPANRQARVLLATCRLYTGQLEPALHELELLRDAAPQDAGILYLLGVGYIRSKQPDKAKSVLNEMFTHAATPAQAHFLLGKTYYEASQFAEAERLLRRAEEMDPALPGLEVELAKVEISQRRTAEAVGRLTSILVKSPDDPDANYFLGGVLVQNGSFQQGIPFLKKALRDTPDSWAIHFYLGKALANLNREREAAPYLKRATELNPDAASLYYQLGRTLQKLGRVQEAQAAFSRVRNLQSQARVREANWLSSRVAGTR